MAKSKKTIFSRFRDWWRSSQTAEMFGPDGVDDFNSHAAAWDHGQMALLKQLNEMSGACKCSVCAFIWQWLKDEGQLD